MKKIISLFLALLMAFSVVTVAFAEGEADAETTTVVNVDDTTAAPEEGETDFGDLQWILDLPFWTVKSGLKIAKIAFKLVSVYLTVAKIFGIVDKDMSDMLLEAIVELIKNSQESEGEDVTETTDVVTTAVEAIA